MRGAILETAVMAALLCAPAIAREGVLRRNVLLIVADDLGVDRVGAYAEHPDPGRTPNIDRLARSGVLFRNAWADPVCSSTRAMILTGRYGFRTGIGTSIRPEGSGHALPIEEHTLPEVLRSGTGEAYRTIAVGKWHLGSGAVAGPLHPLKSGFHAHVGSLGNLFDPDDYFAWQRSVNGVVEAHEVYATSDAANEALRAIRGLPEPWLVYLAFNAPHRPLHAPPDDLHTFELSGDPEDTPALHAKAMVEAMDTEIGRVLAGFPEGVLARTTILFVGDNGTLGEASEPPSDPERGKDTLYEGGVNVPLIACGAGVPARGAECAALLDATDLFATVAELAGVDWRAEVPAEVEVDSVSLVPYLSDPARASRRAWVYAEKFRPNGPGPWAEHRQAIRGPRYKLIRSRPEDQSELYDLQRDPRERHDLLQGELTDEQRRAYEGLERRLEELTGS